MKKDRIIIMCVVVCMVLMMVACGDSKSGTASGQELSSTKEYFADEDFISDLAMGLQKRWDIETPEDYLENDDSYYSFAEELVTTELDVIDKYSDEKFEDKGLQENAITYINRLHEQQDALQYYKTDFEKYYEIWDPAFNERMKLIQVFVEEYGMTVDGEHQQDLKDCINAANSVKEDEEAQAAIDALTENMIFEVTEDDGYGWKTYRALVENTTGKDIDSISFTITLLDENDVIVETDYYNVDNFTNGAKAYVEFSTDVEFASTLVKADVY